MEYGFDIRVGSRLRVRYMALSGPQEFDCKVIALLPVEKGPLLRDGIVVSTPWNGAVNVSRSAVVRVYD